MPRKPKNSKGFTLIELTIVLVIIGILAYGGISVVSIQLDSAKIKQTKDKLDKIEKALQLYYETNGYLPCPGKGSYATSHASFGIEATHANTTSDTTLSNATCATHIDATISTHTYMGVIPVRSLDLPDEFMMDGWNRRIAYAVSKHCTDPDNWTATDSLAAPNARACVTETATSAPSNRATGGTLTIYDIDGASRTTEAAVYAVISYGKNGLGSYPMAGGTRKNTSSTSSTPELKNAKLSSASSGADAYTDLIFYDDFMADYTGAATYFDDIVRWKTAPQLWYEKQN